MLYPFEAKIFMRKQGSESVFFAHTVNLQHTEASIPADNDVFAALEEKGYEVHHIEYCVSKRDNKNPVTVCEVRAFNG